MSVPRAIAALALSNKSDAGASCEISAIVPSGRRKLASYLRSNGLLGDKGGFAVSERADTAVGCFEPTRVVGRGGYASAPQGLLTRQFS